jgi:hypothetical protein
VLQVFERKGKFTSELGECLKMNCLCVQTCLGAHRASCIMGTGVLSLGLNRGGGVTLTTHTHLVPKSRIIRSYTSTQPSAFVACSGTALAFFETELNIQGFPINVEPATETYATGAGNGQPSRLVGGFLVTWDPVYLKGSL